MIREVTRSDEARVLELLAELWPEKEPDATTVGEVLEHYLAEPNYWCYGYDAEGNLKAIVTVSFRWSLFDGGEVALIEDLVVEKGYRGRGIGKSLVGFVEARIAEGGGAGAIEVNSDLHREATHRFWERCGYSRLAFQYRKAVPVSSDVWCSRSDAE